ncbi:MAG: TonB-dependent receptor, partial [Nitrosopumilus sp.]|nr:TonB-dependent receptor [Nitrosopumilus sp.]
YIILLILLVTISLLFASAQTLVKGTVTSLKTKEALPGVNIFTENLQGTSTDAEGNYSLTLAPGDYTLTYSFVGFQPQKYQISLKENEEKIINIELVEVVSELNTVVVSAGRYEQKLSDVTVSMEIMKPRMIENLNTTSLETAVEQIPGVTVIDGQANIRGGSGFSYGAGSRVLVLLDGLPLLAGDANDVKWSFLPLENIAQVEVIKGASSALFGSSALNGVINVLTAYPKNEPELKLTVFQGMYDNPPVKEAKWWRGQNPMTAGYSFLYSRKIDQWDIVAGSNGLQEDGYRKGEEERRIRLNLNTRYRFKNVKGLSAGINTSVQRARGGVFFVWANATDSMLIPLNNTISYYSTDRISLDPHMSYIGEKGSHRLKSRYFFTGNNNDTQQQSFAKSYLAEYVYQRNLEYLILTGGVSGILSNIEGDLYDTHKSLNGALFLQADFTLDRFKFSIGGRSELNKIDDEETDAQPVIRSGINYKITEHTFARASYGEGYRFPSIAERFIQSGVGLLFVYPNDTLVPETGWSAEFGIKQGLKIGEWTGFADVAFFWSEYTDMMEFTFGKWAETNNPDSLFGLGFKSVNIGNTRIKGIDFSINGTGNMGGINITTMAGYTYIDPIQIDFDPAVDTLHNTANYNILKYRFKHMMKADIEIEKWSFILGASGRYFSFMENIDEIFEFPLFIPGVRDFRAEHNDGDFILDLRAGYNFKNNTRLLFITKNALNRLYMGRPADIQPIRSFIVQLSLNIL